jgi:predicted PurR-regulated permease PerM
MARLVSFLVLVAILVIISIIFFQVMAGFFVPLFLAALLGVIVQPLYLWTLAKCRGYRHVAAGVTTALVALIVLLPIGMVVSTATLEGLSLIDRLQLGDVRGKLGELRHDLGLEIPSERDVRRIEAVLHTWREKQRNGEPLEFDARQVKSLIARVESIEKMLAKQAADGLAVPPADATALKFALQQLLISEDETPGHSAAEPTPPALEEIPAETFVPKTDVVPAEPQPAVVPKAIEDKAVRKEDALLLADAEFRDFKRNLLGGTYRSWLTEWANPSEEQLEQLRRSVLSTAGPVLEFGGGTLALVAKLGFGTLIMIVALFFLLAEGGRMLEAMIKISPLEEQHVRELAAEFDRACRAIVSATLLSAIAQGLLAGIGFYFCGLRSSVALLMLLTMVLALVPFTGAAAVWIPVALYLYFIQGNSWAAAGLALYGAVVISTSDNIIKPLVLHGQSKLHPLLALLSVLGGIQALGPIGIVVGPMVVVFLQTLLKIIHRELMAIDRTSWMFWRGFGGVAPATQTVSSPPSAAGESSSPESAFSKSPTAGNGQRSEGSSPKPHGHPGKKRRK